MPEMRVVPGRRRVSIGDKLVLLLFELRLHVGRRCDERRTDAGRLAGRTEQTSPESRMTKPGRAPSTFCGVPAAGTRHPAVHLAEPRLREGHAPSLRLGTSPRITSSPQRNV